MKKKIAIAVTALSLVASFVVGGSLAWLVDTTDGVTNTFTYGNIEIDLWEHELKDGKLTETKLSSSEDAVNQTGFKMVPGNVIAKDPKVTVKAGNEACWLFIEVTESENFDAFMVYALSKDWKPLDGVANVYYQEVDALGSDTDYDILVAGKVSVGQKEYSWADDQVFVLPTVTKEDFKNLGTNLPTLNFKAYAVQRDSNITTATDAWDIANPTT